MSTKTLFNALSAASVLLRTLSLFFLQRFSASPIRHCWMLQNNKVYFTCLASLYEGGVFAFWQRRRECLAIGYDTPPVKTYGFASPLNEGAKVRNFHFSFFHSPKLTNFPLYAIIPEEISVSRRNDYENAQKEQFRAPDGCLQRMADRRCCRFAG